MESAEQLVTDNLDVWTSAIKLKSSVGRGNNRKLELYGIKKLRELILDLAVRGLLVSQDPDDVPASDLLKKIAAEKAKLVKDGKIKKPKSLVPMEGAEKPFDLPKGWEWVRLCEVGFTQTGGTPKKADAHHYGQFIPFIKPGDIHDGKIISFENDGLSEEGAASLGRIAPEDSLLMVCIGTIGKCALVDRNVAFNQQINSVTPFIKMGDYILMACRAAYFQSIAWDASSSTTLSILNKGKWEKIPVPLAPLEEQHRIVAKVEQLMALCDQLEQQEEVSIDAHHTLVKTLLEALTTAGEREGFAAAWERIAEHFDTLFTTEWSIDQLKQTILGLAVMGKLVPQDPSDEPASELLKRIAAEKAQLVNDGKIKKLKALPSIEDDEKPFELCEGWEWCRLQEAIDVRDGTHDSPKDAVGGTTYPLVTSKNFAGGRIDFEGARRISEEDHLEISKRSYVEVDDVLFSMIGGNIGNQVLVQDSRPFSVKNVALFKYFLKSATIPRFFKIYTEKLALELQDVASGGAQPFISLGNLRKLVFALPPSNEQQRIVAKVDELMALCDTLKIRLNTAQSTQVKIAEAMADKVVA